MGLPAKEFNDQDFSPAGMKQQLEKINGALFGVDVPDYVKDPTDENPFPPIKQEQAKNADGSPKVDQWGQPVMIDKYIHKPGLMDNFNSMQSKAHGVEPAGEGDTVNPHTHSLSNTHPGAVDTSRVPVSTNDAGTTAHGGAPGEASSEDRKSHTAPDKAPSSKSGNR